VCVCVYVCVRASVRVCGCVCVSRVCVCVCASHSTLYAELEGMQQSNRPLLRIYRAFCIDIVLFGRDTGLFCRDMRLFCTATGLIYTGIQLLSREMGWKATWRMYLLALHMARGTLHCPLGANRHLAVLKPVSHYSLRDKRGHVVFLLPCKWQ